MLTLTPKDIASWPAPNYVNSSTRAGVVLGIEIPFLITTVVNVIARIVSPLFTKRTLGVEDFVMAFATVSNSFIPKYCEWQRQIH
jgi:hypothetical protein